ncbi:HpcH/HpaI aldolase/citrate lyase family protein [Sphingomonas sp. URHD0057]|uniref:HpcH/HpaI aldolase/citrate lyase family protein n=1 Tax=Sphingomonas sp. URHD0057 TaxID=1380389 RepID=UPI0004919402|nr:CoA ester lyase [Sphingomonas sp. URHD0057]
MSGDLFGVRSVLFLPASNPRAIAKAREAGADLVVLDLEDAVKPQDKAAARDAAIQAVDTQWPMPVAIRVNSVGSEWHALDLDAVAQSRARYVVVPRAESGELVGSVATTVGKPVLAMIETAAGVLAAGEVARESVALIAGTNDLRADLRLPLDATRDPISAALQWIVLAARAAGVAVFDGVFNGLDDPDGFAREAAEGRRLGFDGKSLIHPNQIELCHHAFAPTVADITRARSLVEAFSGGAERFGDEMIERMHVEAAQRVLARART